MLPPAWSAVGLASPGSETLHCCVVLLFLFSLPSSHRKISRCFRAEFSGKAVFIRFTANLDGTHFWSLK